MSSMRSSTREREKKWIRQYNECLHFKRNVLQLHLNYQWEITEPTLEPKPPAYDKRMRDASWVGWPVGWYKYCCNNLRLDFSGGKEECMIWCQVPHFYSTSIVYPAPTSSFKQPPDHRSAFITFTAHRKTQISSILCSKSFCRSILA